MLWEGSVVKKCRNLSEFLSYFKCLFLEMLWERSVVKKCRNLSVWGIFLYQGEYFPHAENLELLCFCSAAFVEKKKKIRGNRIYNSFHQLVVKMGKCLPQKAKVCEKNSCLTAIVIIADLSIFRQIFPSINHKLIK